MNLYLDDDSCHGILATLLRQAGHDVVDPMQAGIPGQNDPVHLAWTIRQRRVIVSKNHRDFEELHLLIMACGGHHPGVIMVRQDNDRARDLTPRGIVVAIRKLEASGTPTADSFIILNQWR
jgi:predicted nuclease of predicted toxin-antitoxin system